MALAVKTEYEANDLVTAENLNNLVKEAGDGAATFNASQGSHDFVVKSSGNANMLHVDGANDQVGIGCDPNATAAQYALVLEGSQYIKSSGGVGGTELLIQDTTAPSKLVLYGAGNSNIVMQDATTSTNQLQSFRLSCNEGTLRFDQTNNTQSQVEATFGRWHRPRDGANAVDATYFASSTFSDVANNSTTQRVGSQLVVGGTHTPEVTYQQHGSAPATLIVTNSDSHNDASGLTPIHGVGLLVENVKAWDATTSSKDNANIVIRGAGTAVQQWYDTNRSNTGNGDAVNLHVAGGKFAIGAPLVNGAATASGASNRNMCVFDLDTGHLATRCRSDAVPGDGLLQNNQVIFYLDGTTLKAKSRNASGTVTIHTL